MAAPTAARAAPPVTGTDVGRDEIATRSVLLIIVAVLALAGAFVALRPEPASAPQERAIEVSVRGDEMTPAEIRLNEGDTAILHVTADREIALHVHGYDQERNLNPGERTEMRFEATLTGRFEIEDEPTETELGALVVQPREGGE